MIAPQELIDLKQRLLLAGDVAKHLANSDGEFLELESEQYALVYEALTELGADITRVLAELDVLRGMFSEKVGAFFMEVANAGDGHGGDGRGTVAGVPDRKDVGRGDTARDDGAADGGRLHRGRAARQPGKRPKSRRNRKSDGGDQSRLDAGAGAGAMDRGEEA